MRASVLQRACRKAQQEVINAGIILEPYSLISIRSAAIHRFLMSDGAKGTSTAQYAGISEAYALQMQSVGLASAVQLPGTKRGYTISDLLDSSNEESSKKHNRNKKGIQRMGQSEEQLESQWDKMLKIKTTGRDDSHADAFCYPYEPTPYCVLERLANSGLIQKKQKVLDYGTGKGRVCFFLSYQTRCHSVGIEYDERILQEQNKTEKMRFQVRVHNLFLPMQKVMKYHQM